MFKKSVAFLLGISLLLLTVLSVSAASATILGDLNGDGTVNNRDLGMLQQYVNGWDVTINQEAADVNGDGKVNNRDYGLLQQYVNGWEVPNIGNTTGSSGGDQGGADGDDTTGGNDGFDIDKELNNKDNFFEVEIGLN